MNGTTLCLGNSSCPPEVFAHACTVSVFEVYKKSLLGNRVILLFSFKLKLGQIGKFAECMGDLSYIQISCAAVFLLPNNSSIVSFCCFTKISELEPWLKFKVRSREIGHVRQTFQSGSWAILLPLQAQIDCNRVFRTNRKAISCMPEMPSSESVK